MVKGSWNRCYLQDWNGTQALRRNHLGQEDVYLGWNADVESQWFGSWDSMDALHSSLVLQSSKGNAETFSYILSVYIFPEPTWETESGLFAAYCPFKRGGVLGFMLVSSSVWGVPKKVWVSLFMETAIYHIYIYICIYILIYTHMCRWSPSTQ